ncbi:MAG: type IV pili methyl-accepting chemotaxis transducer N-terminal domain-containing protein [Rhodocyclaceae bacterium]|nr:type IV pili methyl-accepting chemotaxis transducer N-terminal domain-containing protein [Rhodocyclaceae bacterium]
MNSIRWLLLCLSMAANAAALAAEPEANAMAAINRAGELRMLSQRIVRTYVQIGMKVQPKVDRLLLADSVRRFDANLRWLEGFPATEPLQLGDIKGRWRRFGGIFHGKPELPQAIELNAAAETILEGAERLTQQLQGNVASSGGRMVNLAGRQRMLSQRLAKAYMLRVWGDPSPAVARDMASATREFVAALEELRRYGGNSADIRSEIEELSLQWEWLAAAIATEGTGTYPLIVAEASEAILASADRLTTLYERLDTH